MEEGLERRKRIRETTERGVEEEVKRIREAIERCKVEGKEEYVEFLEKDIEVQF